MNEPSVTLDLKAEHEAYWTVLSLIGERFPGCPIGDYPGCIDELHSALRRIVEEARPLAAKPWGLKAAIEAASKVLERVKEK